MNQSIKFLQAIDAFHSKDIPKEVLERAKQSLFILGSPKAFLYGIQNVKDAKRKTTLTSKINQEQSLNLYDFLEEEESSLGETVDESGYQEDLPFEDVPF